MAIVRFDVVPGPGPNCRLVKVFDRVMTVALTGFVAIALVTLALAVAGVAALLPVAIGGAGLWALLLWGWGPNWRPSRSAPRTAIILAGVAVVVVSGLYNLRNQGEYVVTDRDPGIYVAGGKWIAEHGDLVVDGGDSGLDHVEGVVWWGAGQSETAEGPDRLQIQGAHLFHSVLAVGEWFGGAAGFAAAPALVGALALATFFWLGLRLLPDWAALLATVGLAVNFAWIYTVRSVLSEPTLLLLSFGGAVLLLDAVRNWEARPARLVVAGFVAATALTARVDAGVVLLAFPVLVALLVRRQGPGSRPSRALAWWAAGSVVPLAVAVVDLTLRSPHYLSNLGSEVVMVVAALVGSSIVAVVVARSGSPRWREIVRRRTIGIKPLLPRLAVAAAGLVIVVVAAAWFVRPFFGPDRIDRGGQGWRVMEGLQVREGLDRDGTRTYAERSLDRINWYTGPVAVAAGAAGLAVLSWRLVRGRLNDVEWVALGLVAPCLALYVYAPSIYSDHPWMIRRYVPTAIPGLLLFSSVAAVALLRWTGVPRSIRTAGTAALGAGLLAFPLELTLPLRSATWQAGGREGIERLCDTFEQDDLALFAADGTTALTLLPAVRSFCGVEAIGLDPSIGATGGSPIVDEVADVVATDRRDVEVVAPSREVLEALAPNAVDVRTVRILQTSAVERTIGKPPRAVVDHSLTVWVGTLEPSAR